MRGLWSSVVGAFVLAGCVGNSVMIEPGSLPLVPMAANEKRQEVLWVSEARDTRPADRAGSKIGTLYTRVQKNPLPAFLHRKPEVYVKEQLGRFLFNRRLEAPNAGAAKAFVHVDLEDFSVTQDPGSVWSELKVRVAYTVRFIDRSGQELGRVRLEGSSQATTPFDPRAEIEKAFRDALADSFEALSRSGGLKAVLEALRG
ncbi:MAG: hypothetical protein HY900_06220 [Deltaproteobacteria bacterium]|nr:hypothetical protein [Deltaproteobacteria bacterium]